MVVPLCLSVGISSISKKPQGLENINLLHMGHKLKKKKQSLVVFSSGSM